MIRIASLLCLFFVAMPFAAYSYTDPCPNMATVTGSSVTTGSTPTETFDYCNCLMYPNGFDSDPSPAVALPILECLTDASLPNMTNPPSATNEPRGLIPHAMFQILNSSAITNVFTPLVAAMMTLSLAIYGHNLYLGAVKDTKRETFLLVLKFAGIYYFLFNAPTLYVSLLNVVTELCDAVATGATQLRDTSIDHFWGNCTGTNAGPSNSLEMWQMWDCTLNNLLGFSGSSTKWVAIVFFAILLMSTLGTGITIGMIVLGMMVSMLMLFARFMQTFVMAILGLSMMFFIGFLMVPLMLFSQHSVMEKKFSTWLNLCFGYILTPVIMMGFMCMALVALDIVLFTGDNSLFAALKLNGQNSTYNATPDDTSNPLIWAVDPTLQHQQESFMSLMQLDFANRAGNPACTVPTGGSVIVTPSGMLGGNGIFTQNTTGAQTGSASEIHMAATTGHIGVSSKGLNLTNCVPDPVTGLGPDQTHQYPPGCTLGGTAGQGLADLFNVPSWKYIAGILKASAAGLLLMYIMHAILGFLPTLVSGIAAPQIGGKWIAQTLSGTGSDLTKTVTNMGAKGLTQGGQMIKEGVEKATTSRDKS